MAYLGHTLRQRAAGPLPANAAQTDRAYLAAARVAFGSSRSRDYVLARLLYELLLFRRLSEAEPYLADFLRLNRDSTLARIIRREFAARRQFAPGQPAPPFALRDSSGQEVTLSSFRGKVVYLDFWATWCRPCLEEMRAAPALYRRFAGRPEVAFVAVSLDHDALAWRRWVRRNGQPGVVYVHAPGLEAPVATSYRIKGIPSYWLIGPDGRIVDSAPPRPSQPLEVRKAIEQATRSAPAAVARR
nr:TlpA disulfide reductase family protein [Hymenobacter sp. 15J16-1T3B]